MLAPPEQTIEAPLSERTFVALDGLRGVAAIMVALRHAPFLWAVPATPTGWMKNSYLAVDLFFVLSGFVLEHAYGRRFREGMSVGTFMLARLQRLYPLYALAFILALPFLFAQLVNGALGPAQAGHRVSLRRADAADAEFCSPPGGSVPTQLRCLVAVFRTVGKPAVRGFRQAAAHEIPDLARRWVRRGTGRLRHGGMARVRH